MAEAYPVWFAAQRAVEQAVGPAHLHALHGQLDRAMHSLTPLIEELHHADPD